MAEAVLIGSALIGAAGSVSAGAAAKKAASKSSALQELQGRLAAQEAEAQALRTSKEAAKFRDRQILAYAKSGVTMAGSPLLILEDTIKQGDEEAAAIRKRGYATETLYSQEAQITRSTGRAQYISGITGAAGSLGTAYYTAYGK